MQSNLQNKLHIAIIMDGNGRWAEQQNRPRPHGHKEGVKRVRDTVQSALKLNIHTLTLYAFSADNWKRPVWEVSALMGLLRHYLKSEFKFFSDNKIRLKVIGRRDRLPQDIVQQINDIETLTKAGRSLTLRIALDYSARHAILEATRSLRHAQSFDGTSLSETLSGIEEVCDVDFLIRTGGEQRLSDFLLWECAYAELYFTKTFWPDFSHQELITALQNFYARTRRFGGLEAGKDNLEACQKQTVNLELSHLEVVK